MCLMVSFVYYNFTSIKVAHLTVYLGLNVPNIMCAM